MTQIQTVTGAIGADALGPTLMHEHVFSLYPELRVQDTAWDEEARVSDAVAKLQEVYERGIRSIVDLTVYGLGRNVGRLVRIARESNVQIVTATGLYFFTDMPDYFRRRTALQGESFIEDLMIREIDAGIFETGVKAGIIKCAMDAPGVTSDVEFAFRAAARAQLRTGVPISTHSHAPSENGLDQQRILRDEGVDLGRVVIGHSGDTQKLDYLERLIDAGSYIGMDRFGSYRAPELSERVETLVALCARGYADRIVLSHDTNCWSDKIPEELRGVTRECSPAPLTFISDRVLPALRAAGLAEETIDQMLVHNPRSILAARK